MKINIPDNVKAISEKLNTFGFDAYVVGGCVRDSLLGVEPHDWDICTNAKPDEIERCFCDYKTLDIGKKHGTISVISDGKLCEITTFRVDGEYLDNRHPEMVEFTNDITDDLSRRDFTINAMAYSEQSGLIDPFGGETDLKKGVIKCVGDPAERFNEDALRILRGLRFASRFGYSLETETSRAVNDLKALLANVAYERIREELLGILCGKAARKILDDYREVIAQIIPEITETFDFEQRTPHHCYDVYRHITCTVGNIEPDPLLRGTMLLHDIGKPRACKTDSTGRRHFKGHPMISAEMAEVILKRLKFSNAFINDCLLLIEYHDVRFRGDRSLVKRVIGRIGAENTERLFKVQYADMLAQSEYRREEKLNDYYTSKRIFEEIIANNECCTLKQLKVNGSDIKVLGITDGKRIGEILAAILDMVIDEELENDKNKIIEYIKKHF